MKSFNWLLCCLAVSIVSCSTTQNAGLTSQQPTATSSHQAVTAKDYFISADSLTVAFEDDPKHTLVLHKHDVIHVEGSAINQHYRVHIGEHYALVPVSAASEYDGAHASTPPTGAGQTIHTGPRGGKFYMNSSGKKTYVRKK